MTARFRCILFVGAVASAWVTSSSRAADAAELRKLFPTEAEVSVTEPGLNRLDLPVGVLAACRPDLSDLRLFDALGGEVPFFIDSARPSAGMVVSRNTVAKVVNVLREEVRRETGPPLRREAYDLEVLREAAGLTPVDLHIDVRRALFVARVVVSALPDGEGEDSLVAEGSIFRTGGARPVSRTVIELPGIGAARLRVALQSEESAYLDPVFELHASRELARPGKISVPLRVVSSLTGDGKTTLEVARPRGVVPDLLRLRSATRSFYRKVTVRDAGPGAEGALLGSATLYRLEGFVPIEALAVSIDPARGDQLVVEIEDGDSPALLEPAFEAAVRQPSLVFSMRPGQDGNPAGMLCFGGGRAHLPRYDLGGLRLGPGQRVTGQLAEAVARVHAVTVLPQASLGAARPNPEFDKTPALAFAMRPGADFDASVFTHTRALHVAASAEGLSKFDLDPADLGLLRSDLGDLRIADGSGRQWPYLVERDAAVKSVALKLEGPVTKEHASVYRIAAPVSPLRLDRLRLQTAVPYLDRPFVLTAATDDGDKQTILASGRLSRPVGAVARPLSIDLPDSARVLALSLEVEDGNDAPLAFDSASAEVQVPRVFLAAPEGDYALLLGASEETPPTYELERVRDVVLAVSASDATAGKLSKNPAHGFSSRFGKRTIQTGLFWGALVAAVVALAAITLRLARTPSGA